MITSLYAGLLGVIYFRLSLDTIKARRTQKVAFGSGPNNEIIHMVSAHSNFSSYTPIFLILLFLAETQNFYKIPLHAIAVLFVTGRVLHFYTMKKQEKTFTKRVLGMQLTLFPLMMMSLINLFLIVKNLVSA